MIVFRVLLMVALLATTVSAFNEPKDFKGVKFGASQEEAKTIIQRQWTERGDGIKPLNDWFTIFDEPADQNGISVIFFTDHIGAVKLVETRMYFIDDRFSAAELKFGADYFALLEEAFIDRYGRPGYSKESEIGNLVGGRFINKTSVWTGKRMTATITKYFVNVTHGWAMIATEEYNKIQAKKLQQKSRDTAKGL